MAKKIARRKKPTPEQAAYINAAMEDEKQHKDATIAQAREMFAAAEAKRVIAELKAARVERGLSLADLKERTGMTRESISVLENNDSPNPQFSTLLRLAKAIGVTLDVTVR